MRNRYSIAGFNRPIALAASTVLHLLSFAALADGADATESVPVTLVSVAGVASAATASTDKPVTGPDCRLA